MRTMICSNGNCIGATVVLWYKKGHTTHSRDHRRRQTITKFDLSDAIRIGSMIPFSVQNHHQLSNTNLTMDLQSISSSQSDLILLISTESPDFQCPPPPLSPTQNATINLHSDIVNPIYSSESQEAIALGSEVVLKHMEPRKRSKRMQGQLASTGSRKSSQDGSVSLHAFTNKTEDSSTQSKRLGSKQTFDTSRSDTTGRSSLGSWIRKKMLRFKGSGKDATSKKANHKSGRTATTKKEIPGHVLVGGSESTGTADRGGISMLMGSLSIFGSQDNSIEVIGNTFQTVIADDFSAATFSKVLEEPRPLKFDFRDKLELYKGHSTAKKQDDVQNKVERLDREASFMLLSFSVAPSDSCSMSRETDEDTTDDNLAEAIAKEMDLRRLIMGEPEPERINIKEVTIPSKRSKANTILSPRMNAAHTSRMASTQLDKPTTPLEHLSEFFFGSNNENMDSPRAPCGATDDGTISP